MYIYTSGTTGLPKPAVIKHSRYCAGGFVFFHTSGLKPARDIVYVTLPIYHANGAIIGVGASIVAGNLKPNYLRAFKNFFGIILTVKLIKEKAS